VQDLFGKPTPKPKQTGMTQLNGKVHLNKCQTFLTDTNPLTLLYIVPVSVFT
jgi:hypothetical protein